MKKLILTLALGAIITATSSANAVNTADNLKAIFAKETTAKKAFESPLKPSYLADAVIPSWKNGWFVGAQGGASAFLGSPLGCEDLFGRLKPSLQLMVGKWHTPSIGNRIVYQGFEWKNGCIDTQKYNYYHADFMWNIMPAIGFADGTTRWDIIPFVGVGVIDNRTAKVSPFAINYGVQGRFKVIDRLYVTAELSNATSFRNADGIGSSRKFGDNLLSLTAGVSWTFGDKVAFKKVVDAQPYMRQNDRLMASNYALRDRNKSLGTDNKHKAQIIAELRKILEIEGLLDKYASAFDDVNGTALADNDGYPVNDYSGLNSLRKRLREAKKSNNASVDKAKRQDKDIIESANGDDLASNMAENESLNDSELASNEDNDDTLNLQYVDYLMAIEDGSECIGSPIYFFFVLNSDKLVDESQTINLDSIARIASKYGLRIDVQGAADAATGTEAINNNLGEKRAKYVGDYLVNKGVKAENITLGSSGGISDYVPQEANRQVAVRLYLP